MDYLIIAGPSLTSPFTSGSLNRKHQWKSHLSFFLVNRSSTFRVNGSEQSISWTAKAEKNNPAQPFQPWTQLCTQRKKLSGNKNWLGTFYAAPHPPTPISLSLANEGEMKTITFLLRNEHPFVLKTQLWWDLLRWAMARGRCESWVSCRHTQDYKLHWPYLFVARFHSIMISSFWSEQDSWSPVIHSRMANGNQYSSSFSLRRYSPFRRIQRCCLEPPSSTLLTYLWIQFGFHVSIARYTVWIELMLAWPGRIQWDVEDMRKGRSRPEDE